LQFQQLQEAASKMEIRAKELEEELRKKAAKEREEEEGYDEEQTPVVREKPTKSISPSMLAQIFFQGIEKIETQNDLDKAINRLKETLLKELKGHVLEKQ